MNKLFAGLLVLLMWLSSFAQSAVPIDPGFAAITIPQLTVVVNREYIDPDAAKRVEMELRRSLMMGVYAAAKTAEELASLLNRDMYRVTQDKHLGVAVI